MKTQANNRNLDELPEFQMVLQYLDATSLARLGATNQHQRQWLQLEVASRKQQVALLEQQMEDLLGLAVDHDKDDDDYVNTAVTQHDFTREQVRQAMQCKNQAYALIQSDAVLDATSATIPEQHIFYTELLKFERPKVDGTPAQRSPFSLLLLPLCFYPCGTNIGPTFDNEDDQEECQEMMKADCRRLWSLVGAAAFAQKQANFVEAFRSSPELLEPFRAAARCWVLSSHVEKPKVLTQRIISMMRTTITMIELELAEHDLQVRQSNV